MLCLQCTDPVDLDDFTCAEDLQALGLERLKADLMRRGLKCGGSLQERAQRLFSVKGLSAADIPAKLLAKGKGQGKSSQKWEDIEIRWMTSVAWFQNRGKGGSEVRGHRDSVNDKCGLISELWTGEKGGQKWEGIEIRWMTSVDWFQNCGQGKRGVRSERA